LALRKSFNANDLNFQTVEDGLEHVDRKDDQADPDQAARDQKIS